VIVAAAFLLGLACVFGMVVWVVAAVDSVRNRQKWQAFWYSQLALAYLVVAVLAVGRLAGYFTDLSRGFVSAVLFPIIAVPPFLYLQARQKARALIR
jgi:uncharacterized membrane protein